jgi:hypothetical protein
VPSRGGLEVRTRYILLGISLLLLGWLCWADLSSHIAASFASEPGDEAMVRAGQWGDSFGAFNALIISLALAGVLLTLRMQNKAIAQQHEQATKQDRDRHIQEFDRSFFELLGLMRAVRSEITYKYSEEYVGLTGKTATKTANGPEALSRAAREAAYWIQKSDEPGPRSSSDLARIYYLRIHSRHESRLGPYYRIIYTILRRISEDKFLTHDEKFRYGNLFRSQLQSREVLLLALNGLTDMANNFKDYLVEFRIMKYLPSQAMKGTLQVAYPETAFQARD